MPTLTRMLLTGLTTSAITVAAGAAEIAMVELEGSPAEQPSPYAWLFGDVKPTLLDTVNMFDDIADDPGVDGVVIRLKDASLGTTQIEELGEAIARVRESGKKVHLFAENYSGQELLLGAHVDETIIQSGGGTFFSGMLVEEMFLADTFEWVGLKADLVQVGDYKGANEQYTRSSPSPAWQESLDVLLDGIWGNMRSAFIEGYGISDGEIDDALAKIWFADGHDAKEAGFVDAVVDLAELDNHLADFYGSEVEWNMDFEPEPESNIDMANPFAIFSLLSSEPSHSASGPTIAVLHVEGVIVDGDSTAASMFGGQTTGSRTIRNAIEEIIEQDDIKGLIVRVNSPGGSAIASEVMWQGLQRAAEHKPVWISIGNMAASGGYYVAVGGDKIYVNPTSIVGSIGVVGGKISMAGLYDHLKVNITTRTRGPMGNMWASNAAWTDDQRDMIRGKMAETYDLFTSRVTAGRDGIDLDETAEGRLFTGNLAIDLAMADEIGGLDQALSDMADETGLKRYDVMHFPGPKSFEDFMEEAFGGFVQAPNTGASPRSSPWPRRSSATTAGRPSRTAWTA
jgi:protease-4